MSCKQKQIDKLKEANVDESTIEAVQDYFRYKDMDAKGMLLDPEELDHMQQVEEIADMAELKGRWGTAMTTVPQAIISELNFNRPTIDDRPITIVQGKWNGNNRAQFLVRKNGKYFWTDRSSININNGLESILGSSPSENIQGNYEQLITDGKINSVEEMNKVFDDVVNMDKHSLAKSDIKYLKTLMNTILGAGLRVLPEMNLYVDKVAEVNAGFLVKNSDKDGIYLKLNKDEIRNYSELTAAEIFVHELVHAATTFAFKIGGPKLVKMQDRLMQLREQVLKDLRPEDLMPDVIVNQDVEYKIAEEKLNYISSNLEEFLATALTNKKLRDKLKDVKVYERSKPTKWSDLVIYYVKKVVDLATMKWRKESAETNAEDVVLSTIKAMADAQNRAKDKVKESYIDKFNNGISNIEDSWSEKQKKLMDRYIRKYSDGDLDLSGSTWKKAKNITGVISAALLDDKINGASETLLNALGMKPNGLVQSLLNTMKKGDEMYNVAQELALLSVQIDQDRENMAGKIADMTSKLFGDKTTKEEKAVLQAGIQHVDGTILDVNELVDVYKNTGKLETKIEAEYAKLSQERIKYYKHQIQGLAKYMVTGEGTEVQLRNAEAIARQLGTEYANVEDKVDEAEVKIIDKLATYEAIKLLPEQTRNQVVDLYNKDKTGMKAFFDLQNALVKSLTDEMKDEDRFNYKKGHVRETYDKRVTSTVGLLSEKKTYEAKGYKLIREFSKSENDLSKEKLGIYVSTSQSLMPFNRQAVRFTGEKQMGLTLFDTVNKEEPQVGWRTAVEGIKLQAKTSAVLNELIAKGKEIKLEGKMTPEFDSRGRISNYRYNVSTKDKLEILKMNVDGAEALGRTMAHKYDVRASEDLNSRTWQEALIDMVKNKGISKKGTFNRKEYIEIDIKSDDEMVADIARILPKNFKENIKAIKAAEATEGLISTRLAKDLIGDRWEELGLTGQTLLRAKLAEGKFYVRRDLLLPMFGTRDLSIVDAPGIKKLPVTLKIYIKQVEDLWKSFVSLYKIGVIVKTVPVLLGNLVSNFILGVLNEGHPLNVMKDSLVAWNELSIYHDRKLALIEAEANFLKTKDKKYQREINRINNDIESMDIYPLLKYGLYTQIMEEVETNTTSTNMISNYFDSKLEKMPEIVKTGAQHLYMTDRTKIFQMIQMATAKSDFVARYAQYKVMIKKQIKKEQVRLGRNLTKEEIEKLNTSILRDIRDSYINYNNPDHPIWQYVNDMGFELFTKYALRIQRIIMNLLSGRPIRSGAFLGGQEILHGATGFEPSDVFEKTILTQGTGILYSPSTMKMLETVLEPPIYRALKEVL